MGRVARYKKTKSFDRQTRRPGGSGEYIWGDESTIGLGGGGCDNRKKKKRSVTAEKLHRQKLNRRNKKKQRVVGQNNDGVGGDDDGMKSVLFDEPPSGKDDFDLTDSNYTVRREKAQDVQEDLLADHSNNSNVAKKKKKKKSSSFPSEDNDLDTKPIATITHNQVKIGNHTISCTIPETDADERRTSRLLNLNRRSGGSWSENKNRSKNGSSSTASETTKLEGRREGESITKFNKRLREETKMALLQDKLKSRKRDPSEEEDDGGEVKMSKAQRRKEYLNEKKRKKKGGRSQSNIGEDAYDSETDTGKRDGTDIVSSSFITGERASFLDQAERPPTFKQLPRGAVVAKKSKMAGVGDNEGGMDESEIKKEQDAMEALRKKVVAQYAMVRTRRRMEGGVHS